MSIQDIMKRAVLALGFTEGVGAKAFDSSLKANNGTVILAPTWIAGGGVDLNGTTQYVGVPDSASLTFGDGASDEPFSVIARINAVDVTDFCLVSKGVYNVDAEWVLLTDTDDKIRFAAYDESVVDCHIGRMFNTALPEGEDLDIVGTYDGSGTSAGFKIYVNGQRVDNEDFDSEPGSYVAMENALNHDVWVGRYADEYADGKIYKAIVVPWELTPIEVRSLVESRSPFTATPNLRRGLVLDLDLQEGAGIKAFDRSWHKNNGDLGPGADSIADEAFTSVHDTPVQLAHTNLTPGTTVVTDNGTTFDEGAADDYTMDNEAGTITVLSTGAMADDTEYYIDYDYADSYPAWVEGGGLDFDGIDDYVLVPKNFMTAVPRTWSCLFKTSDDITSEQRVLCANDGRSFLEIRLSIIRAGYYTGSAYVYATSPPVTINTWYHATVVFYSTSIVLYLNALSYTGSGDANELRAEEVFAIGIASWGLADRPLKGIIDELRIYDRALTPTEIRALYEEGR